MESAESSAGALLSRLEQQVLDQYRLTARNLDEVRLHPPSFNSRRARSDARLTPCPPSVQIATVVQRVSAVQPQLLAELRPLEHKLGLILTLFKGKQTKVPFSWRCLCRRLTMFPTLAASVWALLRQRDQQMLSLDEDS